MFVLSAYKTSVFPLVLCFYLVFAFKLFTNRFQLINNKPILLLLSLFLAVDVIYLFDPQMFLKHVKSKLVLLGTLLRLVNQTHPEFRGVCHCFY